MLASALAGTIAVASLDGGNGPLAVLAGGVGVVGVVVLVVTLVLGWTTGLGPALALLALGYLGHAIVGSESAPATLALAGPTLLLVGEVGQWSLDRRVRGRYDVAMDIGRAMAIAWLVTLGAGATFMGFVASGLPVPGGIWTQAAAVAALVTLLALVASVAREKSGGDDRIRTGE